MQKEKKGAKKGHRQGRVREMETKRMRVGDWAEQNTWRDRSTVNHSFIPSALCPLPYCLHMNRGGVILIKRNRVTVVPSI